MTAGATELTSPSHIHRQGGTATAIAAGSGALSSTAGARVYSDSHVTIGGTPVARPVGGGSGLVSLFTGFWASVAAPFTALDLDGDLIPYFLDPDDDGDGIDDIYETGTGFFVSATNTGTSAVDPDSDGDGFDDGVELNAGTDPTDPASRPTPSAVPSLPPSRLPLLILLLTGLASWTLWARKPETRGAEVGR